MTTVVQESAIPNFRKATGLRNLYRSSSPDHLADYLGTSRFLSESERFVLFDATLLVDLRSPSEVDVSKRQALMEGAPGGHFEEVDGLASMQNCRAKRQILLLKDCTPTKADFFNYVMKNWVLSSKLDTSAEDASLDAVFDAINSRGLMGLVEVILGNKNFISTVLKAITIHMERNHNGKVLISCNIGKDRTGVIVMLCESMLGVKDSEIVADFAKSRCIHSLAAMRYAEVFHGRVDAECFADSSPETMALTLGYLRHKYGSIPEYLDSTGFDETWRARFVAALS